MHPGYQNSGTFLVVNLERVSLPYLEEMTTTSDGGIVDELFWLWHMYHITRTSADLIYGPRETTEWSTLRKIEWDSEMPPFVCTDPTSKHVPCWTSSEFLLMPWVKGQKCLTHVNDWDDELWQVTCLTKGIKRVVCWYETMDPMVSEDQWLMLYCMSH